MPTPFLAKRYREFLSETSGTTTVIHIPYDGSTGVDALYGDVDEDTAYGGEQKTLPARLEMYPSRAFRKMEGIGVSFESVIRLCVADVEEADITLTIGDAFILPDMADWRYARKITPMKQSGDSFIEYLVLVSRDKGNRG